MKIISHRGYWLKVEEKNTEAAFERSFELGYGTETDVRDLDGELVISHDIANGNCIKFSTFLSILDKYSNKDTPLTIALNIKADGLSELISKELSLYSNLDLFLFDMSVPDMRQCLNTGLTVFTRMSEVEPIPVWLEKAGGIWLDGFDGVWYTEKTIEELLSLNKRVCVVSSDLHGQDNAHLWTMLLKFKDEKNLILCTDLPEAATKYFDK